MTSCGGYEEGGGDGAMASPSWPEFFTLFVYHNIELKVSDLIFENLPPPPCVTF